MRPWWCGNRREIEGFGGRLFTRRRSSFRNLLGLYSELPAQAGYGDKWPS
jgi:hypothetical protein